MLRFETLLARGGVWFNLPHASVESFFKAAINALSSARHALPKAYLEQLLERERISSTALGREIAIPHPRLPPAKTDDEAFVALAYPKFPLTSWKGLDGLPVKAAFFVYSANQQDHLSTLSCLGQMASQPWFREAVRMQAGLEPFLEAFARNGCSLRGVSASGT